jgi:indole-3-glycerol phosphate synthase
VSLIAEIKRASPSKGVLCSDLDPVRLATTYVANGATAISVLTDQHFFQGDLKHLADIQSSIPNPQYPIPILRKDFIFDPYQVYESRAFGADALLLIAAVLPDETLAELLTLTHDLGMTALLEVHDEDEIKRVLPLRPRVVGINNRNLRDFDVDLATFGRLCPLLPDDVVAVAESGVQTAADMRYLAQMGADAVLVGEALVTAPDVAAKVRELARGGDIGD